MRGYSLVAILICLSHALCAQITFTASTDAQQIVTDQYFNVTFTLKGQRGSNFQAPSFIDFEVLGGPSTSTQVSIVNGRSSMSASYTYGLSCPKPGRYTIPAATVTADGQKYTTRPLTIDVISRKKATTQGSTGPSGGDFIVEASIDYDTGYVGQQLVLTYTLLTTKDVRSFNFISAPEFEGFYAQELKTYRGRPTLVVRDGQQYYEQVMKVFALFPQQRGRFRIDPVRCSLGVTDGRRSNSFFFSTRLKQVLAQADGLDIDIIETPSGAPASYSGAIGDFYMGTSIDKQSVRMDDALTLRLQIKGFGDGKFIEAPTQPYSDLFDIYDPNLLQDQSELVGKRIETRKTFEYLMIPKKTGKISFRPEMTYYNVDSAKYETIYGELYTINVLPGSNRERADVIDKTVELPEPPAVGQLTGIGSGFAFSPMHHAANGALGLGLLGLLIGKWQMVKRDNIDPALKRKNKAQKAAIAKLSTAKSALDSGDVKQFYITLRQSLLQYLSDQTNLSSTQLSKEQVSQILSQHQLSDCTTVITHILQRGEQAIYASISPGDEQADYEQALDLIRSIEERLGE